MKMGLERRNDFVLVHATAALESAVAKANV